MGSHLSFDGLDDVLSVPAIEPTSFTAELLLYPLGWVTQDTSDSSHHFFPLTDGFGIATDSSIWDTWVKSSAGRQSLPSVAHNNEIDITHHVALTYDQTSGAARLYLEGSLASSLDLTPGTSLVYGGGALHISSTDFETYGKIDNVRFYSRALGADEVSQHARGIFENNIGLELLLKLDDGSGTTATDDSGNSNNGTISGATWLSGNLHPNRVLMVIWEHAGEVALGDPIQYTAAVIDGVNSAVISGNDKKRRRVRLYSEADCWVKVGANPTATGGSDSIPLSLGNPEYIDIEAGHVLSAITG